MSRYLIFGDSWSAHSFALDKDDRETKGSLDFQTMFKEQGQLAINYSKPSGSNKETLARIETTKFSDHDIAIVFQTDPLRDVIDRGHFKRLQNIKVANKTITEVSESLLLNFYTRLAALEIPVLLVGGLSCLAHSLIPSTLFTLEQSWTELCQPGFKDCYFEWIDFTELVRDHLQCKDDLTIIKQNIQAKNHVWQSSELFSWCHPSDSGYKIMFDALQSKLSNINQQRNNQ